MDINKPIITQYEPPKNISAMVSSVIHSRSLFSPVTIYSGLISLAIKGYIKINPEFSGDKTIQPKCFLEKTIENNNTLFNDEKELLNFLFQNDNKKQFLLSSKDLLLFSKILENNSLSQGIIIKNSKKYIIQCIGLFFLVFSLVLLFNDSKIIGTSGIIGSVIFLIIVSQEKLGVQGREMQEYIKGFKTYLETVEKERIASVIDIKNFRGTFPENFDYVTALQVNQEWIDFFEEVHGNPKGELKNNSNTGYSLETGHLEGSHDRYYKFY